MPWTRTDPMTERKQFIDAWLSGLYTVTELSERFGISRKTGDKWISRFKQLGIAGLADQSRAPKTCPHRMADEMRELLLETRRSRPSWGARMVIQRLRKRHPELDFPAASTVADLFKREGLIKSRRRRRKHVHPGRPTRDPKAPNDMWTADFKGEFKLGTGAYCYPLTVADEYSRFILGCTALDSTRGKPVKPAFEALFREYGLPRQILTDNGVPFASVGLQGLTDLSVWWIRLGIQLVRTQPGCPQQNGTHERMHRTLKAETTRPPDRSKRAQQRKFDEFVDDFNFERPHTAHDGATPSEVYEPSAREYPKRLPRIEYPAHFEIRRVSNCGTIRWRRKQLHVSLPLRNLDIGFEEVADGIWSIYFCDVLLGRMDDRERRIQA